MVRVEGLEPTHLAALDPKSSVSTNFTTPARSERSAKVGIRIFRWNLQAMNLTLSWKKILFSGLLIARGSSVCTVIAQESGDSPRVQIIQADAILRDQSQPDVQRLIGSVVLGYRDARLHCDSAWRYDDGQFKTMGDVKLQDGSQILRSSELQLNPATQVARATARKGETVRLLADAGEVVAMELTYDLKQKIVVFRRGGHYESGQRRVDFLRGRYLINESTIQIGGDVTVAAPDYQLESDSLHWYEERQVFTFQGPSRLRTQDGEFELLCASGEFDENTESGWFGGGEESGARVRNEAVWLEADSLFLPADSLEPAVALGNVCMKDTVENWILRGAHAERLRANSDTRPDVWIQGSANERAEWTDLSAEDTLTLIADTMVFSADLTSVWPNVQLRQGDSFAECDTLIWSESEAWIQLLKSPKMWLDGWLLRSDSLTWELVENRPRRLRAWGHAGLISALVDSCFQQIAGREIEGAFDAGVLHTLFVNGNAESVYFDEQKPNPCEEFNRSRCSKMRMDFIDGDVKRIVLLDGPEGTWGSGQTIAPTLGDVEWESPPLLSRTQQK